MSYPNCSTCWTEACLWWGHALMRWPTTISLTRSFGNYAFRRRVKPGLTGWGAGEGCRGPTPTAASIERRVEYDLWYIDNWSLSFDFAILLQTPIEMLLGRNAY